MRFCICFFEELFYNSIGLILLKKAGRLKVINIPSKYQRQVYAILPDV